MEIDAGNACAIFEELIARNLSYWNRTIEKRQLRDGLDGLSEAIYFGQNTSKNQVRANELLVGAFPYLKRSETKQFFPLFMHGLKQSRNPMQAEILFMTGCLALEVKGSKVAQLFFVRSLQRTNNNSLKLRNTIGLCLCYWNSSKSAKQLNQLKNLLSEGSISNKLRAGGQAVLGLSAFWQGSYKQALELLNNGLEHSTRITRPQLLLHAGLCYQALSNRNAALQNYNRAARLIQTQPEQTKQLARIEIVRAALHYQNAASGGAWRLRPALAALTRAALALDGDERLARALLENFMGRVYTRSGKIERGLAYLNSALELSRSMNANDLVEDSFGALSQLNKKAPRGFY